MLAATGGMGGIGFWLVYAAFLIGLMYFIAIRPQNKEKSGWKNCCRALL